MRAETRHQLKQDRFSQVTIHAAETTVHWSVEHKGKLLAAAVVVLAVVAASVSLWYYFNQQDQKASLELTQAVRTLETQLRPAGMPASPEIPSFASAKERATQAHKQFQAILEKYPHTNSADFARYFLGVTAVDLGDTASATRELQTVASSGNKDLSALANLALASVYRGSRQEQKAIEIYNGLIAKPAQMVSKVVAQIQLAAAFEASGQPLEAKRIYNQIQKENPNTPVAQLATEKLQALK